MKKYENFKENYDEGGWIDDKYAKINHSSLH